MPKDYSNRDYYEAVLQVRPGKKEVLDYIQKQINNKPGMFIAKVIELKTGVDLYFPDRKFTAQLAKKLKKVFKAKITVSRKLFTQDRLTSKMVYRMTYCVRI
ncbi:MAG: 60S ribosomal export protein NMD3 [Nanoarchaeota archaeon]|nr:60S ribosomal export protein NMD3 [Nanoarchaeota archaeon]